MTCIPFVRRGSRPSKITSGPNVLMLWTSTSIFDDYLMEIGIQTFTWKRGILPGQWRRSSITWGRECVSGSVLIVHREKERAAKPNLYSGDDSQIFLKQHAIRARAGPHLDSRVVLRAALCITKDFHGFGGAVGQVKHIRFKADASGTSRCQGEF